MANYAARLYRLCSERSNKEQTASNKFVTQVIVFKGILPNLT